MKNKTCIYFLFLMGGLLMLANSCKKKDAATGVPVLTTDAVAYITQTSASCECDITSDGGSTVTASGVCWSTSQNPTINSSHTNDGTATNTYSSAITGLTGSTTYYVRAYATNSTGTGYGSALTFTTQAGSGGTVTDNDGNVYNTIYIGTQLWMASNLNTTKYRDGSNIPNITDNVAWDTIASGSYTIGAYCHYNNDANNAATYGKLYNWWAVTDTRNIAPLGWHIPTDAEWTTLTTYIGGLSIAGDKLKEAGTTHWQSPNTNATNSTGFTALPGGDRYIDGIFSNLYLGGYWWSATGYNPSSAWYRYLYNTYENMIPDYDNFPDGMSVRCIHD